VKTIKLIGFVLALGLVQGCGSQVGEDKSPFAPASTEVKGTVSVKAAETETGGRGALKGSIRFEGSAPSANALVMGADPVCVSSHSEPLFSEDLIVNENGTLRNVFVYVKQGLENRTFEAVSEDVLLDQKGCRYEPHVSGIRVNQPLQILNSDNTLHNVHALPTQSKEFNIGMPIKGMKLKKKFSKPEVMVKMKCEVHPWMVAYIGVMEHPFFAVTGADGTFAFEGLPAGDYVIEAWHEKFGVKTAAVTVTADKTQSLELTYA